MKSKSFLVVPLLAILAGCGSYSTSSVKPATGAATGVAAKTTKSATDVMLTEGDITDRPYTVLGDIAVTVRKVTIFDADPTKEKVGEALKEKAASMGADAVVLARYGTVGIGFSSWGVMDGNGRAVVFQAK